MGAKQKSVAVPATNQKVALVKSLEKAGFIESHTVKDGNLELTLKFSHKEPVLMGIKLVTKPGRRVYWGAVEVANKKGSSIYLIHTPKGVLTSKEAIKQGVGGEIIAEVW